MQHDTKEFHHDNCIGRCRRQFARETLQLPNDLPKNKQNRQSKPKLHKNFEKGSLTEEAQDKDVSPRVSTCPMSALFSTKNFINSSWPF